MTPGPSARLYWWLRRRRAPAARGPAWSWWRFAPTWTFLAEKELQVSISSKEKPSAPMEKVYDLFWLLNKIWKWLFAKRWKKNKLNKVNEVLFSKKQSIPVSQRSKDKTKNWSQMSFVLVSLLSTKHRYTEKKGQDSVVRPPPLYILETGVRPRMLKQAARMLPAASHINSLS